MHLLTVVGLCLAACSPQEPTAPPPPAEAPERGPTVRVAMQLWSLSEVRSLPIDGASVCWQIDHEAGTCTRTDAGGGFTLDDVPADTTVLLTVDHPTVFPHAFVLPLGDQDIEGLDRVRLTVDTPEVVDGYLEQARVRPEGATAAVLASLEQVDDARLQPTQGADLQLLPSTGFGAFYLAADGTTLDLGANGTVDSGAGLFLDVDPWAGRYELHGTEADGAPCTASALTGLPVPSFVVLPDRVTSVPLRCRP